MISENGTNRKNVSSVEHQIKVDIVAKFDFFVSNRSFVRFRGCRGFQSVELIVGYLLTCFQTNFLICNFEVCPSLQTANFEFVLLVELPPNAMPFVI